MAELRTAAGYIRVSQERNARNGFGLDAQDADVRRYAEYRQLPLAEVYREAGASGYALKDRADKEVADAIRAVMMGRTYLSPEIAGVVPADRVGRPSIGPGPVPG